LGYPLTAFVSARVDQHRLQEIESALTGITEVVEVHGIAGGADIMIRVVAQDTDDLYRIAGVILASPGIQRTEVSLSMREMVPYRTAPILRQRVGTSE
ncbi:MAG: Lrp/AsnC ligand binding domain-containing protein, partial [Microbacteriaceae bacterium]|nr:Lrp/AsnC ligand binding domain-containing protein [Microbacteriaceae bacterium]